ncbi:imm11 family protein [Commensalibacter communis]|uniref:imm11 family protein n=1 Tax=Commensalibacter communis TaxID=2972786 RepID=UPI0022FF73C5|nr:DUF1629 domain-containing protein [Commensalibacter communis]CAI3926296.1 unnamed protein product [Commensalibacter communis]CAI3928367.1 unnamed protein product [Commensalibacter communis]
MKEVFFALEASQDERGNNYYITPPDFQNYKADPYRYHYSEFETISTYHFDNFYQAKIKENQLTADFYVQSNLASKEFNVLLDQLDIKHRSIPLDIVLYRNKKPSKQYFLTFVTDIISILDEGQSDFRISIDQYTNKPIIEKGFTIYETISNFIIDETKVNQKHLFYCADTQSLMCSSYFKDRYIKQNLIGINFKEINSKFKYDPLAGLM